jgi:maleylacetate reductase
VVRDGRKLTGRDARVRPRLVAYDPALTLGLDRALSLDSLFNALAHSVEALYAAEATPEARSGAEKSLALLRGGIEAVGRAPAAEEGRVVAMRGAALGSIALGGASMGLHHKLAHVLGGTFGRPHARTHATLLPYTLWFNASAAPDAVRVLEREWGGVDPPAQLYDLQRALGLATSLQALGIVEGQLEAIAGEVLEARYPNPRPVEREGLMALLEAALHDRRPSLRNVPS